MQAGVYALLIGARGTLAIGRLGPHYFNGYYVYIGSALGSSGFRRVERHIRLTGATPASSRWHIDYLLKGSRLLEVLVAVTNRRAECMLAKAIDRRLLMVVPHFGSSDCSCPGHLFRAPTPATARKATIEAIKELGLRPQRLWPGIHAVLSNAWSP